MEQHRAGVVERTFHREHADIDLTDRRVSIAIIDDQSAFAGRIEGGLPRRSPDPVECHPNAGTAGNFAHPLGCVLLLVEDDMVRPGRACGIGLGFGGDGADHFGTDVLEPLDQHQPGPARRGMH